METRPLSKDKRFRLVEIVEIEDHPYFIGGQLHPELKSRPHKPAPLFVAICAAEV